MKTPVIVYDCYKCDSPLPTGLMHIIRGHILCNTCEFELVKWLNTKITRTVYTPPNTKVQPNESR